MGYSKLARYFKFPCGYTNQCALLTSKYVPRHTFLSICIRSNEVSLLVCFGRRMSRLQMDYTDASNRNSTVFANPIYTANFGEQRIAETITIKTEQETMDHLLIDSKEETPTGVTTFMPSESDA